MAHLTALGLLAVLAILKMSPTIAAPSFESRDVEFIAEPEKKLTLYEVLRDLSSTNNQEISSEMMEKSLEANEDSGENGGDAESSFKRDWSFKFNNCRWKCLRKQG